jgi:hypothetical protein
VALFLLGAPFLVHRLLLVQASWRTAFFLLIPERPD